MEGDLNQRVQVKRLYLNYQHPLMICNCMFLNSYGVLYLDRPKN